MCQGEFPLLFGHDLNAPEITLFVPSRRQPVGTTIRTAIPSR
jgi:hypothetical protein